MKDSVKGLLEKLICDYPDLGCAEKNIAKAYELLEQCYKDGNKVLICGNGGSAADAEHIVGELMKGFLLKRKLDDLQIEKIKNSFPEEGDYLCNNLQRTLPAISLVSQSAITSAFINDVAADMVFAQQVFGYGKKNDVLIGLSTSGNSKNVVNAVKVAKAMGMKTMGFTGRDGGVIKDYCDVTINVPSAETYRIQEYHLPVYHTLCAMLETEFFDE